jgi:catechol 2,3-dioxygenase-like lactoylglutathione lyase family enzyme
MVSDVQRSLAFYKSVFGMQERFWAGEAMVFLNTPGSNDVITLHQADAEHPLTGSGGILHFGFELENKSDLEVAINQVTAAGGALKQRGEFAPGIPFAYVTDPDGYEIELD